MKIILDEIEFTLPEATFRTIKDSYTLGRVKKANEISKNLWNYQIKFEDKLIECELKYGKNQVSKILCACGRSNTKHPCLHSWIAAYWHFKEIVPQRKPKKDSVSTIKIAQIDFSQLDNKDLARFIQLSLKLHKNLIPWTRLIIPIEADINVIYNTYYQTLSELDIPLSETVPKNRLKYYRDQMMLLEFVYDQSIQHYLYGNLEQSYVKLFSCILKLNQWIRHYIQHNHTRMLKLQTDLFNATEQVLKSIKAPELQESIFQFNLNYILKNPTIIYHHNINTYNLLLENAHSKKHKQEYYKCLLHDCGQDFFFQNNEFESIYYLIQALQSEDFKNLFKNNNLQYISNITWLMLLKELKENDHVQYYYLQLKSIYLNNKSSEVKKNIATALVESLIKQDKIEEAKLEAKYFSLDLLNINFAKIYLEGLPDKNLDLYVNELKKKNNESDTGFLIELYYELKEKERLVLALNSTDDLTHILSYDKILFDTHWNSLLNIYIKKCEAHINQFIGNEALSFVDKIKSHIRTFGTKSQFEQFNLEVQKLFPERKQLVSIKT